VEADGERQGITLKIVTARGRFITADDLIDAITPRTRVVPVSLNLTAMDAAVDLVLRVGPAQVREHNRALIQLLFDSLPAHGIPASPLDAAQRGPYGCFTGQTRDDTVDLCRRLRNEKVVVSMREGRIRVSPHLFNSTQDIACLIRALGR
jgi:selenocysteine lyase/cysteine desulfurase